MFVFGSFILILKGGCDREGLRALYANIFWMRLSAIDDRD